MTKRWIEPVTLTGPKVILEPLSLDHKVVFSIINREWPSVKQSLQFKMSQRYASAGNPD